MLLMFIRKREAIADTQRYTAKRIWNKDIPEGLSRAGGWWNIAIAGL